MKLLRVPFNSHKNKIVAEADSESFGYYGEPDVLNPKLHEELQDHDYAVHFALYDLGQYTFELRLTKQEILDLVAWVQKIESKESA